MDGMFVIISGPSGSGKGTVVKKLDPLKGYALSVSVTTRGPREGELEGRDYFFRSEEEFARMRRDNELLEHALYVRHYYGTPRGYVEEKIAEGRVVVLEIEVMGALQVKEMFPEAVLIFLLPPTLSELTRRLQKRNTEDSVTIDDRLRRALEEIEQAHKYQYLVVNDDVEKAVEKIDAIVAVERMKPWRREDTLSHFINN
ncbi:MAG: guanylate kinase [Defluviitaleaceae bacterium]|nr:guanylate kinase [Defluviitaleaceae bacterium]